MTATTAPAGPDTTAALPPTYTVLLVLPDYLSEPSDDEKHFAVRTRADSPEAAVTRAAGYLLWHFDTDYPDRAAAQEHADDIECIGVARGEITFDADRPITLTAD
jgi:hypothetical protein